MLPHEIGLHNIAELVPQADTGWVGISRVPLDLRTRLNERAQVCSLQGAGCELRFNLVEDEARITLAMAERPAIAEVFCGSFLIGWHVVETTPTEIVVARPLLDELVARAAERQSPPFDSDLFRVVLPWRPAVYICGVTGDLAPPRAHQVPPRRYLAYGSSITHGNNGLAPSGTYAMRIARRLGVDLINLGFGGGAHCEPELADYIAARDDWDFATLELGINMISWLDTAGFAERVRTFVGTIARAHPDKWIACIDLFPFHMDLDPEAERNHAYRAVVREIVAELALPRLVHIDGRDLLRDLTGLCADVLHPAPSGMEEIATNLTVRLERMLAE